MTKKKTITDKDLSDGTVVDRLTFARINKEGELETVDQFTGEVIKREPYALVSSDYRKFSYSEHYKDVISDLILQGKTIASISKMDGMPSASIIYKWREENEDFKKAINSARNRRADSYFDKIADRTNKLAEKSFVDKDDVVGEKHIIDTYKWMAQVDNPEQYGNKTKVLGDANAPLMIQVVTGINRDGDEEADLPVIETTAKIVEDKALEADNE